MSIVVRDVYRLGAIHQCIDAHPDVLVSDQFPYARIPTRGAQYRVVAYDRNRLIVMEIDYRNPYPHHAYGGAYRMSIPAQALDVTPVDGPSNWVPRYGYRVG